jgi:hypothetical protein
MARVSLLRWLLALASAASAIAIGFFVVPAQTALKIVQYAGYYAILAAVIGFGAAAYREYRQIAKSHWTRDDWYLVAAALFIAAIWQLNEVHGFKILMDEMVLSATSMSMHFDREAFVPLKAHEINGEFVVFGGLLDKRPLFFPFLVATLHDLTGYRLGNVFFLNAGLSVLLLVLVGRLGRVLGGSHVCGLLAILLLGGAPIVGLNATGAGFDLLNVVMICAVAMFGIRYLRAPSSGSQDLLVLGTVLLAQTRYESILFVGATGLMLVLAWWQERRPRFSWGLVAAPMLLVTIPLQQKVFSLTPGYWVSGMSEDPFAPKFFLGNLGHAVNFLFSVDGFQSASLPLSMVGVVCTIFAFLYLLRRWKQTSCTPEQTTFLAVGLGIAANTVLVLFYFWGQLDDFMAARLALPLLLLFALSSAFVLGRWFAGHVQWLRSAAALLFLWFWFMGVPFSAEANSTQGFLSFQEVRDQLQFIRAHPGHVEFVMPRPLTALVLRRSAMTVDMLNEKAVEMHHHLGLKTFDDVFVMQRLELDPVTAEFQPQQDCKIGPEFILETVAERQIQPTFVHRISRLKAVDLSRAEPRPAGWKSSYPSFRFAITADPTPTGNYLREYFEKLP